MAHGHPPPTEISKTTLGAVVAAIGATFLLIAALSHSWWTGSTKHQELGVGLSGLEQCSRPTRAFDEPPKKGPMACARLPFGAIGQKRVRLSWAFFGRATFYLTLLCLVLVCVAIGALLGGNQVRSVITPARCAAIASALTLMSGLTFIILKPRLDFLFEVPNVSISAGFGMFMHIFGAVAACAGTVLIAIDAPQLRQPEISYGAAPPHAESVPLAVNDTLRDTLRSPPPADVIIDEPEPIVASEATAPAPMLIDAPPPQQPPPPVTPPCKQCSGSTRYIEAFGKAFCPGCEVYTRMPDS